MTNFTSHDQAPAPDNPPQAAGLVNSGARVSSSNDAPGWGVRRFRSNPARMAWFVMVIAFVLCCSLSIAAPLAGRSFLLYASDPRPLNLNVIDGAVLVTSIKTRDTQAVVSHAVVGEDQRVATDEKSSAILTFYADEQGQDSLATITLYNNASFLLTMARVPRFGYSSEADRLTLYLEHGRIRVSPSRRSERPLTVVVETPHGSARLPDGNYSVEVRNEETQVTTRGGEATVTGVGQVVVVPAGERTRIAAGQAPGAPQSVEQDLLANGSFTTSLDGWSVKSFVDVREDAQQNVGIGSVELIARDGRQAVLFARRGQEGVHAETEIRQDLNVDVRDFDALNITFYVQLVFQSLQGAGMQSSEFPLAVQISYNDIYGTERLWTSGFYYLDLDATRPWPLRNVQKIPRGVWYAYESPNLIELLKDTRPSHVNWIRFYASGYNYESLVSEAELLVR